MLAPIAEDPPGAPRRSLSRSNTRLSPRTSDVSHHQRIHHEVAERGDRRQISDAKRPVRPHKYCHLAATTADTVWHPTDVHDAVHGLVRDLQRELVVGHIQRGEQMRVEI